VLGWGIRLSHIRTLARVLCPSFLVAVAVISASPLVLSPGCDLYPFLHPQRLLCLSVSLSFTLGSFGTSIYSPQTRRQQQSCCNDFTTVTNLLTPPLDLLLATIPYHTIPYNISTTTKHDDNTGIPTSYDSFILRSLERSFLAPSEIAPSFLLRTPVLK